MRSPDPMGRAGAAIVWLPVSIVVPASLATLWVPGATSPDSPPIALLLVSVVTAMFAGVGALIITRRPGNTVGWILWAVGLMFGLNLAGVAYLSASLSWFDGTLPATVFVAWLSSWTFTPSMAVALLFLPLLFPDGRLPSGSWTWVLRIFVVVTLEVTLLSMLTPGRLGSSPYVNPTGWTGDARVLVILSAISNLGAVVGGPIAVAAAVVRYRRGSLKERQQLKWFGGAATVSVLGLAGALLIPHPTSIFAWLVAVFGLCLIPVSIGIAILRYRLYDIDRIISRTISWTITSGLIGALFAGLAVGLQSVLSPITQGNTLAVAGSTLVALAVFQPLRRRVQAVVDRRFNRARYDAQRTVEAFVEQVRDDVDLGALRTALVATAGRTMRPAAAGVWIRGGPRDQR